MMTFNFDGVPHGLTRDETYVLANKLLALYLLYLFALVVTKGEEKNVIDISNFVKDEIY